MISLNYILWDIETLCNCSTWCFKELSTGKKKEFVLFDDINVFKELISFIIKLRKHNYVLVGFNSINFDAQILEKILHISNNYTKASIETIIDMIYQEAQRIVNLSDDEKYLNLIPEWKLSHNHIDLYRISHFDNRAKRTSLKWLEFTMRMEDIQEMPIPYDQPIVKSDIKQILKYNWHDVEATEAYFNILSGKTDLKLYKGVNVFDLREDIKSEFKIKCDNYNDVKIGDEINKTIYSNLTGIDKWKIPKKGTERPVLIVKDCIDKGFEFKHPNIIKFYNTFLQKAFNPRKVKQEKMCEIEINDITISFGFGGIHSIDQPRIFETNEEYYLSDKDCTGMYPRNIIERNLFPEHLGEAWNRGCKYIYDKRAYEYKPKAKTDPRAQSFSEAFKLASNGGSFGKTNEPNSWQYDPLVAFSVTLFNQFALVKYCEMMIMNGIKVISANTDGTLCYVKHSQKELYDRLGKEWEKLTKHELEETLYTKFVQLSVNDYIAIETNGKFKYKGDFTVDPLLYKNPSFLVIPKALEAHFIKGQDYREYIASNKDIYDFCAGIKVKRDFVLNLYSIENREPVIQKQQKVTRYFCSTKGGILMKDYLDGRQVSVNSQQLTTIVNKIEDRDYISEIDYGFYIKETKKIIDKILKPKKLTLL